MKEFPLEQLWDAIMGLAEKDRAIPIKDKVWVRHIHSSDDWTLVVNGTKQNVAHEGFTVSPFNAALWCNGWLAASFGPSEGLIAAGSRVNLSSAIEALTEAAATAPG